MHELSTMMRLISAACNAAEKEKAKKITELNVEVGEMTDIVPEYLVKYFPEASKGTLAENAVFNVKSIPVRVRCLSCGREYEPSMERDRKCPTCSSIEARIITGRNTEIASMQIEN
jgi:hydrogenase nickel incorporation protein HypA/HybF